MRERKQGDGATKDEMFYQSEKNMEKELLHQEEVITPEIAKRYLDEYNLHNRPMNMDSVKDYVRQIQSGLWKNNGEAICFDWNGRLANGQHRLAAVVYSGIPVKFLVVRNVDPDAFASYDAGRNRRTSDVFFLDDIPNYVVVASIVRKYNTLINSERTIVSGANSACGAFGRQKFSNQEILNLYKGHSDVFQTICKTSKCLVKKLKLYSDTETGAIMAYLHLSKGHSLEQIFRFFKMLFQYETEEDNTACRLLRERIIKQSLSRNPLTGKYKQQILIKCWNDYLDGSKLKRLQIQEGEILWFK